MEGLLEEAGCDGVFYSVQNAEITRFTYDEYRSWVTPSDKKVLAQANTPGHYTILHCCGWDADEAGTTNRMEVWKDYESAAVSWAMYVDHLDPVQIREFFGGRAAWGGFDNRRCGVLYRGDKEAIEEETRRIIALGGKKGFILGPDCSLPDDIDPEHIKWVLETARRCI